MNSAGFPVNDLLRRRLQTCLTVTTLTLSVASTLFLLLFSSRLGVGISSATGTLTLGLTAIFGQFILFIGALIFIIGCVMTSFIVFLMMEQRTRDFGLIKAVGCPNSLVAGYFMTEFLTVAFFSCLLGLLFGFLVDFVVSNLVFSSYQLPNFWFAPVVFITFFVLAVFFGLQPLFKAAKMSAIQALSPVNYYGLILEGKHKTLKRSMLIWRVASRSLMRRLPATTRIVILLSLMFTLLTVSVAGCVIANDTTNSWIQKSTNNGMIVVAHTNMGQQFKLLLSTFSGGKIIEDFNYSDSRLSIPKSVVERLTNLDCVSSVNQNLVLYDHVKEIGNFTIIDGREALVGDSREGDCLIIGLNPWSVRDFSIKGRNLEENDTFVAIIGDSIVQNMYSNPLVESIEIRNRTFNVVGVCVDAINNGLVTYVPIDTIMNVYGIKDPNLLKITITDSIESNGVINEIRSVVKEVNPDLDVFDFSEEITQNTNYLTSIWQTIMFLPLLTLISTTLCLVGYMMLALDEQRQEFAMLRAIGAKPKIIINISAIQGAIVLFSSFGVGISFGVIATLMTLIENPLVTSTTIVMISGWLILAVIAMFILCLNPAFKLAKSTILRILA